MKKQIVKYEKNILKKVCDFFRKLFYRKNSDSVEEIDMPLNTEKQQFKENIKFEEDKEQKRILELQKKFEDGLIDEDDLSNQDYIKLEGLYEKQIETLEMRYDRCKRKILETRKQNQF